MKTWSGIPLLNESLFVDVAGGGELDTVGLGRGFEGVEEEGREVVVNNVVGVLVGRVAGLVSCAKEEAGSTMDRKRSVDENGRLDRTHRHDLLGRW